MTRSTFARLFLATALLAPGCGESEPAVDPNQQAAAEAQAAVAAKRREAREKVAALLKSTRLVIGPANGPATIALRPDLAKSGSGSFQVITGEGPVTRVAHLGLDPSTDPPSVRVSMRDVTLSPVPGTPTSRPSEVRFVATIAADGTVTLRDPAGRTLRVDEAASKTIVAASASADAKRREPIDALHRKLGGATTIQRVTPVKIDYWPSQMTLLRVEGEDAYELYAFPRVLHGDPTGKYAATVIDGKATLANWDGKRRITFDGDALAIVAGDKPTPMRVVRTRSVERLKADVAAAAALIADVPSRPVTFVGTLASDGVWPIRFELTARDGDKLTGTFRGASVMETLPLTVFPKPSPIGVEVAWVPGKSATSGRQALDEAEIGRMSGGSSVAMLEVIDGAPRLRGPGLALGPVDPAIAPALRAKFDAHLSAGGRFDWALTTKSPPLGSSRMITLSATGDAIAGKGGFGKYSGDLTGTARVADDVATLTLTFAPDPANPRKTLEPSPVDLWILPRGDSFVVAGYWRETAMHAHHYVCYAPAAE